MTDDILERALVFYTGSISDSATEGLTLLCSVAQSIIERKLKNAETFGSEIFISAAALLALSMYAVTDDGNFTSATIGNITLNKSGEDSFSDSLKRLSDEIIRPFVDDEDFAFMGVRY